MDNFLLYFELGLRHILDIHGYDHILFVIALGIIFVFRDWRRVLVLITAFTIGHSITLALSAFNVVDYDHQKIEKLIVLTILITAVANLFRKKYSDSKKLISMNSVLALFFGLIHGLGFSTYFKTILGREKSIIGPLFAFNIGLEVGQIIVVFVVLLATSLFVDLAGVKRRDWVLIISSAIAGIAVTFLLP
ncbi:HupE/UreJ family protein [Marinigracilibium pacificum]|uniref:HupE/UreJ family protein n=1 Tax=Marinigracilibium pacificum TaxID=2729599 RepID=A0A848IUF2_9BACT|nr:HupE/UreJ family protein [Marinigracilibium pacificum]NMM46841.1 HupE/UreJ family protein [Marinigracilibium pacificum]